MRNKLFLLLVMLTVSFTLTTAQLTVGEPGAKTFRTGNRAEAGDFGVYFGMTSNVFRGIVDADVDIDALPLINIKYMNDNTVEYRCGIEIWRKTERYRAKDEDGKYKSRYIEREYKFSPGIAWHFDRTNLLDVYGGVELPFGFGRDAEKVDFDGEESKVSNAYFHMGPGAFIGLQCYIGYLPLALGFEYGLSSNFNFGADTWKVEEDGGKVWVQADDISSVFTDGDDFDKLKHRTVEIGNQFRVTLSYYFHK